MNREQLCEHVKKTCDKIVECFQYKNNDYGKTDDGFHNFREAARRVLKSSSTEDTFKALWIYAEKHIVALENTGLQGKEAAERLIDIAVYCMLAHAMLEEDKQKKAPNIEFYTECGIDWNKIAAQKWVRHH